MSERVVLLTGGNLGNVAESLAQAENMIAREIGVVVAASQVMESEAWGFESKHRFLNQVLVVETTLTPHEVLRRAQSIECRLGRVRTGGLSDNHAEREGNDAGCGMFDSQESRGESDAKSEVNREVEGMNGCSASSQVTVPNPGRTYQSRTMDIDILFYGERIVEEPDLTIPHPLIAQREFVLRPLVQVLSGWPHPLTGLTPEQMLAALDNKS